MPTNQRQGKEETPQEKVIGHLDSCGCAGCSFLKGLMKIGKIQRYEIALQKIAKAPSIYCSSIAREALKGSLG